MVEARVVIDHLDRKDNLLTTFSSQRPLDFVNIKTVLELHLVISEKSQRRYPQNAVGKHNCHYAKVNLFSVLRLIAFHSISHLLG